MTTSNYTPETEAAVDLKQQLESFIESHDDTSLDPDDWGERTVEEGEYLGNGQWKKPETNTVYPPQRVIGAGVSDIVRYADELITRNLLSPEQGKVYAVAMLTTPNIAKQVLKKKPGTVDATISHARGKLDQGIIPYGMDMDAGNIPIITDITWSVERQGTHTPGDYHIFKHISQRERYLTHQYTVLVEERSTNPDDVGVQQVAIHRFESESDLVDWLYNDRRFGRIDESEFWHEVLTTTGFEPSEPPVERLTTEAVGNLAVEQPDYVSDWGDLDNFDGKEDPHPY